MPSGWQKKLARVSQMNWDEIRTRAAQEFHKRRDLVLYRFGVPPTTATLHPAPLHRPQFLFPSGSAQERMALLRVHLPTEALEILHEADDIRRHHFHLLGYDTLDYGDEIDWHLDRVHGKNAPLDPWFKIPFLDFAVVGDHKVTWELNRHQHLLTLAKAWLLSKDERYPRETVAQWHSWIKANPYPLGINWGSSLEAAFRTLSWIWVDHLLPDAPGYTEFHDQLVPALAFHGTYIERYLSTYFSPNTHLLGEAVALFFVGTLYPQIPAATRWQKKGWEILLEQAQKQVRPDGVYFEQSLHYHVYALDFFLYARLLAAKNGHDISAEYDAVILKMLDVVQSLAQAGPAEGFGDDDGGRVFNPRRNRTEHMSDPLALGALLYRGKTFPSARLTEESIWLFGQEAIDALPENSASPYPISTEFPDGGLFILADALPFPNETVVDAGPQGVGHSGHGHADALSLRLTMNGERWLVDAGSGVYISANSADRNVFRGTAAHNTMEVDRQDQAQPEGPFSWSAIPTTRVDTWAAGKTFTYFAGSHDGYARLADSVTHCRCVVKINGGPMLVRDQVLGEAEHDLQALWHFGPELELRETSGNSWVASHPGVEGIALEMIVPDEAHWKKEISRGLLSPAYGRLQPAALVRVHTRLRLPAEIATLLHPRLEAVAHDSSLTGMRHAAVQVYEWVEENANHGFCFALDKRPWNFGPWFSDAEFLYCRIVDSNLTHLIMVGGTYIAWQGQELLKAPGPSKFFEWRQQDGILHAEPDQCSVSAVFQELTGGTVPRAAAPSIASTYAEKH